MFHQQLTQSQQKYLNAFGVFTSLLLIYNVTRRKKKDLGPKTILITGCANGIGRAIAISLLKRGDFIVGSDLNEAGLRELEVAYPTQFLSLPMNVAVPESVADAAARLLKYSGKPCLDVIVNNAGVLCGGPLVEMDTKDFVNSFAVNVTGTFLVVKHFFPLLIRSQGRSYLPRIINLGSEVSYAGISAMFNGAYAISKFGVEAYSAALRQELSILTPPVLVTILNPGAHETAMTTSHNIVGKNVNSNSQFAKFLKRGSVVAEKYIASHQRPASGVGEIVAVLAHELNPPARVKINVSMEMEIMRWIPQSLLDRLVRLTF